MVGFAQLIAEANGLARVQHVTEKISELMIHATMVRAGQPWTRVVIPLPTSKAPRGSAAAIGPPRQLDGSVQARRTSKNSGCPVKIEEPG
jgi:hypothetical protein